MAESLRKVRFVRMWGAKTAHLQAVSTIKPYRSETLRGSKVDNRSEATCEQKDDYNDVIGCILRRKK